MIIRIRLPSCPLFEGIAPEALLEELARLQAAERKYKAGETLLAAGSPTSRMGLVLEGELHAILPLPQGRQLLQSRLPGAGFAVGELWIEPFATPHDAAGSVGYVLSGGGRTMALCTDLGYVTDQVRQAVAGCDLLVCETNYDPDWMRTGPYPYALKQRIMGDHGHLSNEDGAELAAMGVQSGASVIVLAHLSAENNTPARALETVSRRLRAMGCDPEEDITLAVAPRKEVGPTYRLERRLAAAGEKEGGLC